MSHDLLRPVAEASRSSSLSRSTSTRAAMVTDLDIRLPSRILLTMFYIVPQNFPEGEQEGIGNVLSPFLTPYEERPPKQLPSPRASGTTPGERATMAAVVDTFVWAIETSNPN